MRGDDDILKKERIGAIRWRVSIPRIILTPSLPIGRQRKVARMACRAKLWAVNANWYDGGWNLNANSVENPNPWSADNQVCSRYSHLPSVCVTEVFFIISFLHAPTFFPIISRFVPKEINCSFDIK